ncbi:ABC transporter permease [Streptomyces sp. NL15-2K]|uniref:ABC transporter permease n=1 Tax=Streptomyces sp. NL15-2K TaxID=376149 RepID=UPI000F58506C|nr:MULTISPECIES: ABC transporter permease [Actinomycetes]WKX15103.1 ABC transporter permease [Kutzneria buriramensis]GCB52189.1 ribose ABC transport system [Streptomyces sp. NL15-2K]
MTASPSPSSPRPRRHRPGGPSRLGRSDGPNRPARPDGPGAHLIGAYGLLALTGLLFLFFSLTLPQTFPTLNTVDSILYTQSIPAVLALAAMVPIVTGAFDLSIGYGLGLAHVMVMQLVVNEGWSWPLACLAVIVAGVVVGVLNGVIVEFGRIDSFIATLGTGSMMYAVTGWVTDGGRIVPGPQGLPDAFTDLYNSTFLGLPVPAFYVLAIALVLWLVLERLPLGRYLYVVGSNPRAADLVGIPVRKYTVYAFAASGLIVGFAGVLLAAQQQIGNPSVGLDYLLPAFVGALLGSTAIKPGRPNAMGTLVAVAVLAVGLTGIGQMGADFWTVPLFHGGTLLLAVGLAGYAARRRLRTGAVAARDAPAGTTEPPSSPPQEGGTAGSTP